MENFTLWGIVLGALSSIIYLIKNSSKPKLAHVVTIFLSTIGVIAGAKMIYLSIVLPESFQNIHIVYIIIGGISVMWVSIATIITIIKNKKEKLY